MKASYKRNENFSKLLYNINFYKPPIVRNSKTVDKNENLKKDDSSPNIFKPEIEYVTKLNFFNPKTTKENDTIDSFNTMNNINDKTTNTILKKNKINSSDANKIFENNLENKRKRLENKIINIKILLKPLNEDLKKILSEIENLKLDFEILQNNNTCSIIEKNFKKKLLLIDTSNKNKRTSLPILLKNMDKKLNINSIISQRKKDMKSKKNFASMKLAQLKEKKREIIKQIKLYENDLQSFREEKNKIKNELLSHYHKLLFEGKDIRNEGLSWIIISIWNLKSDVFTSYLPKFLDEESISFLFSYSLKKMRLREIYKVIKKLSNEINNDKNKLLREIKEKNLNEYEDNKENFDNNKMTNINNIKNSFDIKELKQKTLFNSPKERLSKFFIERNINRELFNYNNFIAPSYTLKTTIYKNIPLIKKEAMKYTEENKLKSESDVSRVNEENIVKRNSSFNRILFNKKDDFKKLQATGKAYELYNEKKYLEKKVIKLKNEIKSMIDNELIRINNNINKEGYGKKNSINKFNMISTIIGEENARNELQKQIIESKNYFNILKNVKKDI